MDYLYAIPASLFELIGVFAGLTACFVLLVQLRREFYSLNRSSLSRTFLIGWIFIYAFWGIYGVRFDAVALWFTNALALSLQAILCLIVFRKQNKGVADDIN